VFPPTVTQLCIVHQIRNSLRYFVWKEKKEFTVDMKKIYHAATIEAAEQAAIKVVYLAISNIEKKWTMPIQNWGLILQQLLIKFEERCRI